MNVMNENNVKKCSSCGSILHFALEANLKIGGGQDLELLVYPSHTSIRDLLKSGETALPLDVYVCPDCGKVELFASAEVKKSLIRVAGQRSRQ
jgi:predicted RNA-binding Zn-ribbon protein involved in translation (DUF1610 family)